MLLIRPTILPMVKVSFEQKKVPFYVNKVRFAYYKLRITVYFWQYFNILYLLLLLRMQIGMLGLICR